MRILPLLSAALLLLPAAWAHPSADPLDVETLLLRDEADDQHTAYDGYDIMDLYVREASFPDLGDGMVFRVILYGGFAPGKASTELPMEVSMAVDGETHTFRITTTDGSTWTGEVPVIETELVPIEVESDAFGDTFGLEGYIQFFVAYDAIGASLGDTVGDFSLRTYADGDLRDLAPGGIPVPGTNGAAVQPAPSEVVTASIELQGAMGYTQSTFTVAAGEVTVQVGNPIQASGQHLTFSLDAPTGWTVTGPEPQGIEVGPGENATFTFTATATPESDDLTLTVRSDLGGRETLTIPASQVLTAADSQDTPFPATPALVLLALGILLRRRD